MSAELEKLRRSFRRAWACLIIAGAMMVCSDILNRIGAISTIPIYNIGVFLLLLCLFRLYYIEQKMKQKPEQLEVLNDEYRQHLLLKSFKISYGVLCAVMLLLLICRDFFSLSAEDAMKIIMVAVFATPHIVFWILDREA